MRTQASVKRLPQHLPELDGLRAVAALGIIVTHVSFQTGTGWGFAGRFDFFVAVFFALSAFLLWRRRGLHTVRGYAHSRIARLAPAYYACVVSVVLLLPDAHSITPTQILANLTSTQIYVADGLAPGLTHLWSLCVEFFFYLVLPLLVWAIGGLPQRWRMGVIAGAAVLSWGWGFIPFVADYSEDQVNSQIWPPAYASWFAVGMLAAEVEERGIGKRTARILQVRWAWVVLAGLVLWVASRDWFGPAGLVHPEPAEFARRIIAGAVFAACVVVPVALVPRGTSWLNSPLMQALGAWSYSIFLWHVAVLAVAFPLTGVALFSGKPLDFWVILAVTVIGTVVVSAASYTLIERPGRDLLMGRVWGRGQGRRRRKGRPAPRHIST